MPKETIKKNELLRINVANVKKKSNVNSKYQNKSLFERFFLTFPQNTQFNY